MTEKTSFVKTDTNDICPISTHRINKNVSRLNALITAVAVLFFIFTPLKFVIILLAIDFFIKAYVEPSCSPVSTINRNILNALKIAPKFINAGPKIFAAKIGFVFCLAISILAFYNFFYAAHILSWTIIAFSAMEFLFGYCIGCHAYSLMQKLHHQDK